MTTVRISSEVIVNMNGDSNTLVYKGECFNAGFLNLHVAKGELPASIAELYMQWVSSPTSPWEVGYEDGMAGKLATNKGELYEAGYSQGEAIYLASI